MMMNRIARLIRSILVAGLTLLLCCSVNLPGSSAAANTVTVSRDIPDVAAIAPGDTLRITVTFAAPGSDFNSVVLHDQAPNGWQVAVDTAACVPAVLTGKPVEGNGAEFSWLGPYEAGQTFTAVYTVSVPAQLTDDTYTFSGGWLVYYLMSDKYQTGITGDAQIAVTHTSAQTGTDTPDETADTGSPSSGEPEETAEPAAETTKLKAAGDNEITVRTPDNKATATLQKDTVMLTADNRPLTDISITAVPAPKAAPEGAGIIGDVYDFGPDGATFEPDIAITLNYHTADIPPGTGEENLVICYYEPGSGEWRSLNSIVDADAGTVTAYVNHFTAFSILAYQADPPAAVFTVTMLSISPSQAGIGDDIYACVLVTNSGGASGSYNVPLLIDGVAVDSRSVTVAAGESKRVDYTVSKATPGTFMLSIGGLAESFTVTAPTEPEQLLPPAPEGASVNWMVIGGASGGAAVIIVVIILMRNRKQSY